MTPNAVGTTPVVLAHRGGADEGPENTVELFKRVTAAGVTHIETDAQVTADGLVVLSHDETLDRCYDGEGPISDYTYEELKQHRNAAGEPLPLLRDVLEQFPETFFNIDVKTDAVADPVLQALREMDALDRTLVASFSERRLERLRAQEPRLVTSLGVSAVVRLLLAAETVSKAESWLVPGPRQQVLAAQVPETNKGIRVVSPRFIATAHAAGLAVHVWTVNDVDRVNQLLDWGVDGIVTDRPTMVRELIVERGQAGIDRS